VICRGQQFIRNDTGDQEITARLRVTEQIEAADTE
jgi:hypothetical protein